jgi:hypothetical protein
MGQTQLVQGPACSRTRGGQQTLHVCVRHTHLLQRWDKHSWFRGPPVREQGVASRHCTCVSVIPPPASYDAKTQLVKLVQGFRDGRSPTRPFRDARGFPSTRWYRGLHVRRWGLGFVHRSRAILCRAVPNPRVTRFAFLCFPSRTSPPPPQSSPRSHSRTCERWRLGLRAGVIRIGK